MRSFGLQMRFIGVIVAMLCVLASPWRATAIAADGQYQTADGLAVYFGVVPAEIVKGHPSAHTEQTMHGGAPAGQHEHHLVVAVFDAATGVRVSDAKVTAQFSGRGIADASKTLEPMDIENTITYGGFFDLPGPYLYKVKLTIQRTGADRPVLMYLVYDHRQ